MTLRTELVMTRGRTNIVHDRIPGSPRTICGYAIDRLFTGRVDAARRCAQCGTFPR